jgi:hypothetical protein
MRRFDVRVIFGVGLILLGGLMFVEKLGFLHGASALFWGLVFLTGAAYFFKMFLNNPRSQWWAVIPAMVLLGMGGEAFLPSAFKSLDGAFFLGSIGIAFWVVYLTDRSRWWSIIPGGVLMTLAVISALDNVSGMDTGSILFMGLALTFLLVALLPNPVGGTQWAYIPAAVLAVIGALLGSASTMGLAAYIWPAAMMIGGILIIFGFFSRRE